MHANERFFGWTGMAGFVLTEGAAVSFADPTMQEQANDLLGLYACTIVTLDVDHTPGITQDITVPIDGQLLTLKLAPHSVRSVNYEVRVQVADGSLVSVEPGPVRTVRGEVAGINASVVAGAVTENGLLVLVDLPDGARYWIEPLFPRIEGATPAHHAVYRTEDVIPHTGWCAAELEGLPPPEGGALGGGCDTLPCEAELACDADFEYFQDQGTVGAVEARINLVINTVNVQYERDVGITHLISAIIVRTAEPNPYSSSDSNELLMSFREEWLINQPDVPRDLAQLFTGKDLGGVYGHASAGVCTPGAYSFVRSNYTPNLECAAYVSAHELGHTWGASHCSCPGTTMNSGLQFPCPNHFHPVLTIPLIVAHRNSRLCLVPPGPAPQCDPPGPNTSCWDGGGGIPHSWSVAANWNPDLPPAVGNHVLHPSGSDVIQMDVGSSAVPREMASYTMTPDGIAGLTLRPGNGLRVIGSFGSSDPGSGLLYNLTLEPRSLLEVSNQSAFGLRAVNIALDDAAGQPQTRLTTPIIRDAVGVIGPNTRLDTSVINLTNVPGNQWTILGAVNVTGPIAGAGAWSLSQGASITVADGTFDIDQLLLSEGATVSNPSFTVTHLRVGHQLLLDGQGTSVDITLGIFSAGPGSTVTIRNGGRLSVFSETFDVSRIGSVAYGVSANGVNEADFDGGLLLRDADSTFSKAYGQGSSMTLTVKEGDLEISSRIHDQASAWDATGVRLVLNSDNGIPPAKVEAVSPDFDGIWFADSPCAKPWGEFDVSVESGAFAIVDEFVSNSNAHVIQETQRPEVMYVDGDVTVNNDAQLSPDSRKVYLAGSYSGPNGFGVTGYNPFVHVCKTLYGDWNGNCQLKPLELLALRRSINCPAVNCPNPPSNCPCQNAYPPIALYDFDCNGELTVATEEAQFKHNVLNGSAGLAACAACQDPPPGVDGTDLTKEQLEELAKWVADQPPEEQDALSEWIKNSMTQPKVDESVDKLNEIVDENPGTTIAADAEDLAVRLETP